MASDEGFPTSVAVVEEDAFTLSQIVRALGDVQNVTPYNSLGEFLVARPPAALRHIVILGPSQAREAVLGDVNELVRAEPGTGALLVVAVPDATVLRLAIRAGLDDAVPLERIREDLRPAVEEVDARLRVAVVEPSSASHAASEMARGRVASVFSPKGGVGRSVVAVNLAVSFASKTRRKVVLIDADPQFGDVSVMLRLSPAHTFVDAVAAGDRLDSTLLESLLTHDSRSGIYVLAAPTDPTTPAKITAKSVSVLLEVLRAMGALVVVDTPRVLDDVVVQFLSESDDIVYLVGMDIPSVKNARLGLQVLELVQIPLQRVLLVLNRADSRVQLSPRDVEKVLEMKLDVSLPSDALVPKSVNRGAPAVLEHSRFAGQIHEMADLLLSRGSAEVSA